MPKTKSEPNAQNSELDPNQHPSGARIERMMNNDAAQTAEQNPAPKTSNDGAFGEENVRGSEREQSGSEIAANTESVSAEDEPAEGGRDEVDAEIGSQANSQTAGQNTEVNSSHRQTPEDR